MHASNVRYMLAYRAVEAGDRLAEVPVWLRECESYAASHRYWHELAHIHRVRAVYERMQGRLDTARDLSCEPRPYQQIWPRTCRRPPSTPTWRRAGSAGST
jgi:hypothetical protein